MFKKVKRHEFLFYYNTMAQTKIENLNEFETFFSLLRMGFAYPPFPYNLIRCESSTIFGALYNLNSRLEHTTLTLEATMAIPAI